jgi:hypothetical protein
MISTLDNIAELKTIWLNLQEYFVFESLYTRKEKKSRIENKATRSTFGILIQSISNTNT